MVAGWRPDWAVQVAFNADPNDPAAIPDWEDLTTMVVSAGAISRGRQYELAQTQAAQPTVVFRDVEEYLNPANTASPYWPDVKPYRQILWQGLWPNDGTTGNLLNAGMWCPNDIDPYDPSFEAYTNGDPAPYWITAVGGTVPTITTTNPQQGTKDVTYTVAGTATVQGVEWAVPCMPGRQYTSTAYLRQTTGSTQQIGVVGSTTGSSTTTTGAYVRLTVVFTATQPEHTIQVATTGTATAGTVNVDAVQHEPGGTATAFTTTGQVIYPVMRNYVERWPRRWTAAGFVGWCDAPCVDGFAALNSISLRPEYEDALRTTAPDYWWPMGGGPDATSWPNQAATDRPPLSPVYSKYGAGGDFAPGTAMGIPGGAGSTGIQMTSTPSASGQAAGTCVGYGQEATSTDNFTWPVYAATWGASVAAWATLSTQPLDAFGSIIVPFTSPDGSNLTIPLAIFWPNPPFNLNAFSQGRTSGGNIDASASALETPDPDTGPHLLVATITQTSGANTTIKLYIDGVEAATNTQTTASLGGLYTTAARTLNVGGWVDGPVVEGFHPGAISDVALWSRALTAGEVTSLWTAGGLGNAGETSGERVARHLAAGDYTGSTRISTGSTTMQAPSWTGTIDLLTDSQNTTVVESGTLWIGPDGAAVFEGRQQRFLRLASLYTLGEDEGGGEYPYLGDVEFDYDPNFVYADVTASREGGAVTTGGLAADIAAAAAAYFPRSTSLSGDMETDSQAQDLANWTFYTHRAPMQRVSAITLDPAANNALWPVVLSIEVGQRVTVVRRAPAANSGAGLVMVEDYFVEQVSHDGIDMQAGTWTTTLLLSPIGTAPDVTVQPWILNDADLSVLGSTTVLGF